MAGSVPATEVVNDYSKITRNDFPEGFVFGTGTSAYQVEGAAAKGGRGISIWDEFTLRTTDKIADGSNGNVAIDMYHRYKEDIKIMKSMGFNAYRFSISWPRLIPSGKICLGVNREAIDYYNDLINTVLKHDMQPHVTLFHWDLPILLEKEYRGFLGEDIVDDYRDYVDLCFWEFGDRVKHWATFNEPWTYCYTGYVKRTFPPGIKVVYGAPSAASPKPLRSVAKKARLTKDDPVVPSPPSEDPLNEKAPLTLHDYRSPDNYNPPPPTTVHVQFNPVTLGRTRTTLVMKSTRKMSRVPPMEEHDKEAFIAARNMILAHGAAIELYNMKFKNQQKGEIGIVLNNHCFEPVSDKQEDIDAARRVHDFKFGWFLEPVLTGKYPKTMRDIVPHEALFKDKDIARLRRNKIDFLGLNYYSARYVQYNPNPDPKLVTFDKYQYASILEEKDGKPIGTERCPNWLIVVPWGIKKILKKINKYYNKPRYNVPPVYITENGVAQPNIPGGAPAEAVVDTMRVNYYRDHLGNLLDVINEWKSPDAQKKLEIKGFFAWSCVDNFEWLDGYSSRFGIIYIDYLNDLRRYPKLSAKWFSLFLGGVVPELLCGAEEAQVAMSAEGVLESSNGNGKRKSVDAMDFKLEGEDEHDEDEDEDEEEDEEGDE